MVIFFHVKEVSRSIHKELQRKENATIHSVYKNTINILLNKQIISIQPHNVPKTPMSITIVESDKTFDQLDIHAGEKVIFHKNKFIINNHNFDLTSFKLWDPSLRDLQIKGKDFDLQTIKFLCNLLKTYGKREGLRDIALYFAALQLEGSFSLLQNHELIIKTLPMVENLIGNTLKGEIETAVENAVNLVGMGPGLTPSGDDFLMGFLSVLLLTEVDMEILQQLRETLKIEIENSLEKTTFLSKEFLIYGCRKEFCETFHCFYTSLKNKNSKEITASTMEFIKLGHSSGSDTLSGIITGMLLISKLDENDSFHKKLRRKEGNNFMIAYNQIKENAYYDSVTLMVISSKIAALEGVQNAAVMMGTDHNKELMKNSGLLLPENENVGTSDMIIGILAENQEAIDAALEAINEHLANKKTASGSGEIRVKTLDSAIKRVPDLNFTVISVPGKYAKNEAMKALDNNLHVLLFSDNVTMEEENELKEKAVAKGLLMMGPDCGTVIINGTALGFANGVNRGNIGMVAAAGTGLQEVTCIVDKLGGGVSQALGTGGRDLKEEIGGKMMLQGLNALAQDEETDVIVLISKPPAPTVMEKVLETVKNIKKPVVTCFLGGDTAVVKSSGAIPAETLEDAAAAAVRVAEGKQPENLFFTIDDEEVRAIVKKEVGQFKDTQKYIRGLYSGGTLCYEGMLIVKEAIGDVSSNVPLKKDLELVNPEESVANTFLDMGEDYFTDGLPHPMIDTRLRVERIKQEGRDPEVAVILLDVVLGYGCHEDPAGALVPAIVEAKETAAKEGRYISVVASICGTDRDPQNREEQEAKLRDVGVIVMPSNAQAARMASLIVTKGKHLEELLGGE